MNTVFYAGPTDGRTVSMLSRAAQTLGYTLVQFNGYTRQDEADPYTGRTPVQVAANHEALMEIQRVARHQNPDLDYTLRIYDCDTEEEIRAADMRAWWGF